MCHREGTGVQIANTYVQVAANTENALPGTSGKKKKKTKCSELVVHKMDETF